MRLANNAFHNFQDARDIYLCIFLRKTSEDTCNLHHCVVYSQTINQEIKYLLSVSFLIRNLVDMNLRKLDQGFRFCCKIQYLTLENYKQINSKLFKLLGRNFLFNLLNKS